MEVKEQGENFLNPFCPEHKDREMVWVPGTRRHGFGQERRNPGRWCCPVEGCMMNRNGSTDSEERR